MDNDHDWELVKENVQPLRQGRTMSALTIGLRANPQAERFLKEKQREFEQELRSYDGHDPLDVWFRYIKWTEQHFPKGGQEGNLPMLIEKCLVQFQSNPKYVNDSRFIKLWIMFANFAETPADLYSYMFDNGIGDKVTLLYVEWAQTLEIAGNMKKADSIYTEGLNRMAEPRDLLIRKQEQFQNRLTHKITLQLKDKRDGMDDEVEETGDKREVLTRLKPLGASRKVGTVRTGDANLGSAGRLKDQRVDGPAQVPSMGFTIFTDENDSSHKPLQTNEWKSMPNKSVDRKENDRKAGVWTSARLKQRSVLSVSHVTEKEAIKIHKDQGDDASAVTPLKTVDMKNKPLSLVKAPVKRDVLTNLRQSVPDLNTGIPVYPKYLVYNGMDEYSLEELKAVRYWKQVEAKAQEEKRIRKEALMEAQLKEQAGRLDALETLLRSRLSVQRSSQESQDSLETNDSQTIPHQSTNIVSSSLPQQEAATSASLPPQTIEATISSSEKRKTISAKQDLFIKKLEEAVVTNSQPSITSIDTVTPTNLSTSFPSKPSSSGSVKSQSNNTSQRTPIFNTLSAYSSIGSSGSTSSLKNLPSGNTSNSGSRPYQNMLDLSSSLNQSSCRSTPANLTDDRTGKFSALGRSKPAISAPSPTVFTKEAVELVQGMFCAGIEPDSIMEEETDTDLGNPAPAAPLQICQDKTDVIMEAQDLRKWPASCKKDSQMVDTGLSLSGFGDEMMEGEKGHLQEPAIAHAREDMTIASISMLNMKACAASTPFHRCDQKTPMNETEEIDENQQIYSESHPTPFLAPNVLSPVFEGSHESSGSDTQSTSSAMESGIKNMTHPSCITASVSVKPTVYEDPEESMEAEEGQCVDNEVLDATCNHIIDTSACLPPEATEALLSASVNNIQDPYDQEAIKMYLSSLRPPVSSYPNYLLLEDNLSEIKEADAIYVGNEMMAVNKSLGKGGYAQVFEATCYGTDDVGIQIFKALKVQKPPCYWEFYIACEIQRRLSALNSPMDVRPSLMSIDRGYFNHSLSALWMGLMEHGSILNLVNLYKSDAKLIGQVEGFACLATIELLHLFEQLHQCDIIHGDVKPDNFLLNKLPKVCDSKDPKTVFGSQLRLFCLTDFGQSIDMHMFPKGTMFKTQTSTKGFECIEMRSDNPWTYQTDLFGLAGTIHVLLFGSYMKVFVEKESWKITANFVRKWNVSLWKKLFHELLNIPSCDCLPNLASLRAEFEEYFCSILIPSYNDWVNKVQDLLKRDQDYSL